MSHSRDPFTKIERSRIMAKVKAGDTTPELLVRRLVHKAGYRYRLHVKDMPGTPDIVFRRLKKVINVNGCFWHLHGCRRCRLPTANRKYWITKLKRNASRDRQTKRTLRKMGWSVLEIWECQLTQKRRAATEKKILAFLSATRSISDGVV